MMFFANFLVRAIKKTHICFPKHYKNCTLLELFFFKAVTDNNLAAYEKKNQQDCIVPP